ncbi:hypothetical protein Kpol_462p9 [Vanderwaltozyma polyspora DSM 70294]|uniref:Uncharacterized protein n=1 Tax=Vanderwaltozyma polyspora (strain ATCC 22028 / DSM 70294 / BCRC 21397 / CBS 2163 / NBRC 10782 / NRRL Y-8283 / UCD 57-17) TaxID=436907 RepID=A7TSF0_VANPO|nr:uncharacterized protein Kpol_462p9 [Vanderwaltozyma polyspora DSM 70294]EDO14812.1 hypothetical protein Kpol_462p9 [Vanderwaltozyma polyspora DSM 70294]
MAEEKIPFNETSMKQRPKFTFQEPDLENSMVTNNNKEKAGCIKIRVGEVSFVRALTEFLMGCMVWNFIIFCGHMYTNDEIQFVFGNDVQMVLLGSLFIIADILIILTWFKAIEEEGKIKIPNSLTVFSRLYDFLVNRKSVYSTLLLYIITHAFRMDKHSNQYRFIVVSILYHLGVSEEYLNNRFFIDVSETDLTYI